MKVGPNAPLLLLHNAKSASTINDVHQQEK